MTESPGRCGGCHHWTPAPPVDWQDYELERYPYLRSVGTCNRIEWDDARESGAVAAIDMPGQLTTRAEFGCTLWEEMPKEAR